MQRADDLLRSQLRAAEHELAVLQAEQTELASKLAAIEATPEATDEVEARRRAQTLADLRARVRHLPQLINHAGARLLQVRAEITRTEQETLQAVLTHLAQCEEDAQAAQAAARQAVASGARARELLEVWLARIEHALADSAEELARNTTEDTGRGKRR